MENLELRQQITHMHPYCRSLPDASLAIIVCGNPQALPNMPGEGFWQQDCAAATENILLQATELGYGTCWCGIYPDRERSDAFAALLGVQSVPFGMVIVGTANELPARRGHLDPEHVRYLR